MSLRAVRQSYQDRAVFPGIYPLLMLFALLAWPGCGASAADSTTSLSEFDALAAALEDVVAKQRIPGAVVAITDGRRLLWQGAFGERAPGEPMTAEAIFPIASGSKLLVSLAVLQLVEQGKLALDDRLADVAPEVVFDNPWRDSHPLRIVHLLEHTTGWDETHYPEMVPPAAPLPVLAEVLAGHPHSRTSRWAPGSRYAYSNVGPTVAAYLVEKFSGISFDRYLQHYLLAPLGMADSNFSAAFEANSRVVTLHDNQARPLAHLPMRMWPSGQLYSTVADLGALLRLYLNRGEHRGTALLSPASIERSEKAHASRAAALGIELGYGLGNFSSMHGPWVFRGHNGGIDGAQSEIAYLPKQGLGLVILMNAKQPGAFRQLSRTVRDFVTRQLPKPGLPAASPVAQGAMPTLDGTYMAINPRMALLSIMYQSASVKRVRMTADGLALSGLLGGKQRFFRAVSSTAFRDTQSGRVALAVGEDPQAGQVLYLVGDNGAEHNYVMKRVNTSLAYGLQIGFLLWLPLTAGSVIYALYWLGGRSLPNRRQQAWRLAVAFPFAASGSLALCLVLLTLAKTRIALLAAPTWLSLGIYLSSVLFGLFALAGAYTFSRWRSLPPGWRRWYLGLLMAGHLLIGGYLASFGLIGWTFWG